MRFLIFLAVPAVVSSSAATVALSQSDPAAPRIEVWTSQQKGYQSGENARVYFRTTVDGYVTVLHVDPEGRPRVLFPERPSDHNAVSAGYQYLAAANGARYAFAVRSEPGTGYLVGVVSRHPFDYGAYTWGRDWDYRKFGHNGNVSGDVHDAVRSLIHDIVASDKPFGYAYDVVTYEVEAERRRPVQASDGSRRARGSAYRDARYGSRYHSPYYGGYSYPYYGGYGRFRLGIGHFSFGRRYGSGHHGFGHRRFGHHRFGRR